MFHDSVSVERAETLRQCGVFGDNCSSPGATIRIPVRLSHSGGEGETELAMDKFPKNGETTVLQHTAVAAVKMGQSAGS
jgi:hypothetical protein